MIEKEEKTNPQKSIRSEIIYIRAEINETANRKKGQINETES